MPRKISVLCVCGCGKMTRLGSRYIKGHNNKGKKFPGRGYKALANMSDETKKLRVLKANATKNSPEGKLKQRAIYDSEERNEKISKKLKAYYSDPVNKKKSSDIHWGQHSNSKWSKRHPNVSYNEYHNKVIPSVLKRDSYTCVLKSKSLGMCSDRLDIHHVVPSLIGLKDELCDRQPNLVTICSSHHAKIESQGKWKNYLRILIDYLSKFKYFRIPAAKYLMDSRVIEGD